jgi:hypothetical protein
MKDKTIWTTVHIGFRDDLETPRLVYWDARCETFQAPTEPIDKEPLNNGSTH